MLRISIECHTECRYADCTDAEYRHAACHHAECRYSDCTYAEYHHSTCHHAECHYAECRRAKLPTATQFV